MKKIDAQKKFLKDTVDFFSEDTNRRAVIQVTLAGFGLVTHPSCKYRTSDGRKCAIGLHIPDKKYVSDIEGDTAYSERVLNVLPKSIQKLGKHFLTAVQQLHDNHDYWNESGLTKDGLFTLNEIETRIESNYYDTLGN